MQLRHVETIARRMLGAAPEWALASARSVQGGLIVEGSPATVISRGKNKGRKRWSKPLQTVIVTEPDYAAEIARYEREEGKCHECFGEGKTAFRWSRDKGTEYRECRRCKGAGVAPAGRED